MRRLIKVVRQFKLSEMLEKAVIVSLITLTIYGVFMDGMVFSCFRKLLLKLPKTIHKPVFDCPFCMTPYWGSTVYFGLIGGDVKEWVIVILAASGLNFIISIILDYLDI